MFTVACTITLNFMQHSSLGVAEHMTAAVNWKYS